MNFTYEETDDRAVITFRGSLSKAHASEIREILMFSWGKTRSMIINFDHVAAIDRLCMQIFCTAYRLSLMTNTTFVITGISDEALGPIAENPPLCYSECHAEFPISEFPFYCLENCIWSGERRALK